MRRFVFVSLLLPLLVSLAVAQASYEFWPGVRYDPSIPTLEKVLGYKTGEQITSPEGIVRYMEALARAAPSRMKVWDYGKTWEGRRLIYVAIGSAANISRLDALSEGMRKLADPRKTSKAEADKLIGSLPATVWLAYGVHGNEISSPEASLLAAYHLLAARNDAVVDSILKNTVVFIDPLQNPDGRNRFLQGFVQSEGLEPNANPEALEHDEAWPGGRTNHYLFDMNRDWFALTQPETQGRVKILQKWYPLVFVDLHEMGADSTYYFGPEAIPYNPHIEKNQRAALDWFGRNNAKWFDQFGFSYFTREVFDAFYPGYGASWPSYYGSVAMTYEQASARGLVMRRRVDGVIINYRDTVRHHFVSSVSTCETTAKNREQLLRNFYNYRVTAIEEGRNGEVKEYVFPRTGDVSAVDKLADLLARQGIDVRRSTKPFQAEGKECPAGSYAVSLAQPSERFIRTLLDPEVDMNAEFLKEQERKRKKHLRDDIYDVIAWSLPLMYNVEMISAASPVSGDFELVKAGEPLPGKVIGGKATVAYLVPWGSRASGRLLAAALRQGLTVWSADKKFELSGREFPRGTLIFKDSDNADTLGESMAKLARTSGAEVVATDTAYVVKGISLGSSKVIPMKRPAVAIAWDTPVAGYAAGNLRFVIERQFGYPTTPIRTSTLASRSAELDRFDVLILPAARGGYRKALGESGLKRLKAWVRDGGTLIAIESAMADLADPKVDLLSISREYQVRENEKKSKTGADKKDKKREAQVPGKLLKNEADWKKAIEPEKEPPDSVPGVLVRARLDPDNWLTAGLPETVNVMLRGRTIYTPIKLDKGVNAAVFESPEKLIASGYMWEENKEQLAFKPFVVVQRTGRGTVVGFTSDPNFRAYMDGLNMLFVNAIFRSQSRVRMGGGQ